MRPHGGLDSNEDSGEAAYQAGLGAINGAAKVSTSSSPSIDLSY
jgi:hypothetical protein